MSFDNSDPARSDEPEKRLRNNFENVFNSETRALKVLKDMENRRVRLLDDEEYFVENLSLIHI